MPPFMQALHRHALVLAPQLLPVTQEDLEFAAIAWRMAVMKAQGAADGRAKRLFGQFALVTAMTCVVSIPVRAQLRATTGSVASDAGDWADRSRPNQYSVGVQ